MLKVRRCLMLVVVTAVCSGMALRTARAELDTQLLAHTLGMLDIPEAWLVGAPRTMLINGARVRVATGHSPESLHTLLDRAQAECRARSGGLHTRLTEARAQAGSPALADGILRAEKPHEGLVACLDLGGDRLSMQDLAERLSDFAERGDLQALGGVRMLRAQSRAEGAFFVSTWSEGSVPLWQMFPDAGDAPGADFADAPRPAASRRVLSAWQEHGAPAINVYAVSIAPELAFRDYATALAAQGWSAGALRPARPTEGHAQLLLSGGHQLLVTAARHKRGTLIAVMQLDAGPGLAQVH